MEFGLSWERLDQSKEVSRALREETLERLKDALERGTRPEARIRHAYHVGEVARKVRIERKRELDTAVDRAENDHQAAQQELATCVQAVREHSNRVPDFRQLQSLLDKLTASSPAQALKPLPPDWEFTGRGTEPLDEICAEMKERFRDAVADWLKREAAVRAALPAAVTVAAGSSDRAGNALVRGITSVLDRNFGPTRTLIEQKFSWNRAPWWRRHRAEATGQIRAGHQAVIEELQARLAGLARDEAQLLRNRLAQLPPEQAEAR